MPPGKTQEIVGNFIDHFRRKKSSGDSLASTDTQIDTNDNDTSIRSDDGETVATPIEMQAPGSIAQSMNQETDHNCVNSLRTHRHRITGVKKAELKDIVHTDIIIIVMGSTGVGKTSFISAVAGKEAEWLHTDIGHNLSAGTNTVNCVRIPIPETQSNLVLVDTPGFDDPDRSNALILEIIATWLEKSYRKKQLINGIIYLHRITDIRFDAGATATLNLFKQLCGGSVFGRVALTTSMWSEIQPGTRPQYEEKVEELRKTQWKSMLARKQPAIVSSFDSTTEQSASESAVETIWNLIKHTNKKEVLLLQRELVDEKKSLPKTQAGKVAFSLEEKVVWQLKHLSEKLNVKNVTNKEEDVAVSDQ